MTAVRTRLAKLAAASLQSKAAPSLQNMTNAQLEAVIGGNLTNEELLAIVHGNASPELCQRFETAGATA